VPTLCAFANRPGGGTVILGLDEASGFTPVGLADRRRLKASFASKARQSLDPPVVPEISEGLVDGEAVVVAVVPELASSQKPCRVSGGPHRGVWVRAWDGDYRASDVEIQGLLAGRGQPRFDSEPAPGATRGALDAELVDEFVGTSRA